MDTKLAIGLSVIVKKVVSTSGPVMRDVISKRCWQSPLNKELRTRRQTEELLKSQVLSQTCVYDPLCTAWYNVLALTPCGAGANGLPC